MPIEDMSFLNAATMFQRMVFYDNEVRFSYQGMDNLGHLLGFDVLYGNRARHAIYPWVISSLYNRTTTVYNVLYFGTTDGGWYQENSNYTLGGMPGTNDENIAKTKVYFTPNVRTGYYGAEDDPETQSEFSNLVLDLDPALNSIVATALFADGTCYVAAIPTYIGGHLAMGWATDNRRLRQTSVKTLAAQEGVLAGSSGGAAVFASLKVAQRLGAGKHVVTIIPDSAERYLSKKLFEGGI